MRVLVAFLLSVLGCSLAEGRLLSKCDLKNEFVNLDLNFVAKIVYYVERTSGFNTSAVTHETEDHSSEGSHANDGGTVSPHSVTPRSSSGPPHQDEAAPTFYGLFQLSNLLACRNGTTPSPDICSMDCNDFIDDDISDDLECLLKVHAAFMSNAFGGPTAKSYRKGTCASTGCAVINPLTTSMNASLNYHSRVSPSLKRVDIYDSNEVKQHVTPVTSNSI